MGLRTAVAVPFKQAGTRQMGHSEFVVALSLDRDWFSPEQAKRLIDVAASEGLLTQAEDELRVEFDPATVEIPEGYVPDADVLRQRSTFERVLETVVEAGTAKQEAVAAINALQTDLGLTLEAAAIIYARRQGLDVADLATRARDELTS